MCLKLSSYIEMSFTWECKFRLCTQLVEACSRSVSTIFFGLGRWLSQCFWYWLKQLLPSGYIWLNLLHLCWIVFTFNGYRTVQTFFLPGIYYIYILHILIDNIVSGINAPVPCERPLLLLIIVYTTFGL